MSKYSPKFELHYNTERCRLEEIRAGPFSICHFIIFFPKMIHDLAKSIDLLQCKQMFQSRTVPQISKKIFNLKIKKKVFSQFCLNIVLKTIDICIEVQLLKFSRLVACIAQQQGFRRYLWMILIYFLLSVAVQGSHPSFQNKIPTQFSLRVESALIPQPGFVPYQLVDPNLL